MLRAIAAACLLAALVITSGCAGRETDEVSYVIAIGIDKADDDNIKATYQVAIPKAIGEGGKGADSKETTELISVTANNLAEARSLLNSVVSRDINLSHVKGFVFGEEYARKGLADYMAVAMRFREFRGTMFIGVVNNGTAEEFLRTNSPKLEVLPARYLESQFATAENSGYYLPTQMHDFYRRLKTNRGSPFAALFGINHQTGQGVTESPSVKGDKAKEYTAGNIPRQSKNPVEIMGTALFSGDKMVGTLTNQETRMVSMLLGEFGRGYLVVVDPLVPEKSVNVHLRLGRKPKIDCWLQEGQVKIHIDLLLEGEITSLPSGVHYEAKKYSHIIEEQTSRVIEREMTRTLRKTQDMAADIVGFGGYFSKAFATYDEYAQFNFEKAYPRAEITLVVKTTIRRTGLMWQTTPIPKGNQEEDNPE